MFRLARMSFFQNQTRHSKPNSFCLIRKNSSESAAVKPESEINKLGTQDHKASKTEVTTNLSDANTSFDKLLKLKNTFSELTAFKTSGFQKIYDSQEAENVCNTCSPFQAIEAFKILANSKTRPFLLLKSLSSKIRKGCSTFNLKNCADVMYCAASLSFKDIDLLNDIAKQILTYSNEKIINQPASSTNKISENCLTSILYSCGKLKYRNCELIDFLLKYLLFQKNSNKALLSGLITLGTVNFMSIYGVILVKELLKLSDGEFPLTKTYIDFVWACVLINQFPVDHISKILSQDFFEHIQDIDGLDKYSNILNYKLLNINAAATYLIPSYSGPKLDEKYLYCLRKNSNSQFLSSLIDGLSHIFPKNGYLNTNVDTGAGFFLDVECYIDKCNEPVPLRKGDTGIKIGIMLIGFNDVCLGEPQTLIGYVNFKKNILKAQGYKVVEIFWNEYQPDLKLYDKVEYLRKKIGKSFDLLSLFVKLFNKSLNYF